MERFGCATQILCGEGALEEALAGSGQRLAVITEPFSTAAEAVGKILEDLKDRQILRLEDVSPEPALMQAVKGAEKIKAFAPEGVIAVGDRGVMDCAKAMTCFSRLGCPLTVIPTQIGTGTEVTDRVTLTHDRRRHILRDDAMRPARAVLDDGVLGELPRKAVREGGFRLLAAALESYTGRQAGLLTDIHARESFSGVWAALPASLTGNTSARRRVQVSSVLAGLAADRAGLGLCSALGNSLGCVIPLNPGILAAVLLPAVVSCNAHAVGRKYAELARASGMGGGSESMGVRNLKTGLLRLRQELGLPQTLAKAGVDPRLVWNQTGQIVEMTLEHPDCRNNPLPVDDYLVRRILEEITGRF